MEPTARVDACIINHNTSPFAELALRSLIAMHQPARSDPLLDVTIIDNDSDDDGIEELRSATAEARARWVRSRWPAHDARCNTHGDVLRDFVMDRREADMLLFVDADVMFDEPDTIWTMVDELRRATDDVWAVQARYRWMEKHGGAGASLDIWQGTPQELWVGVGGPPEHPIVGRHKARCNPFCVLIRNSELFLRVAEDVGLSASVVISQDEDVAGFADTLGLASSVMATHRRRYMLSSATVTHFAGVTHLPIDTEVEPKLRECRRLLARFRDGEADLGPAGPWS